MKKIERALISVSDKTGIVELAHQLVTRGVTIISTGGTAKLLKDEGLAITPIEQFTGFPEMLDGRVKTLHPKVHAGLLSLRDNPEHQKTMREHDLVPIDLVVVNLYPFEATVSKPHVTFDEAVENIDIGGPTMLRSAAKNFRDVTVIVDPADYKPLLQEMDEHGNAASFEFNKRLAQKVFAATAYYDSLIADYLGDAIPGLGKFPATRAFGYRKVQDLRYGENPHQQAAFYKELRQPEPCVTVAKQIHGKELSYNNFLDADGALELVKEFAEPAAIIIKHTNPCGAATASSLLDAYVRARETDPVSAFGSVISFNRVVDKATAEEMARMFIEIIIAPGFSDDALAALRRKKDLRLLVVDGLEEWVNAPARKHGGMYTRKVVGGLLVQDRDTRMVAPDELKCVTAKKPGAEEMASLLFAWKICKHVKSNAIVFARGTELVGVGAGQMSRVDSVKLACMKAQKPVTGAVMASDAFFPFRDGIDEAAKAGITAAIQPGGSVRDKEVIEAADEHGIAMVLTGMRHFKH
ncbi:bifunctional phosphoribosylaminoimidazolecarboxamide formyltransferase/IMP cyclohydrolase [bacterium]|nr:bifunctional phosphoribosylaminoimidazolecarboxamide formyltransferase/IMP cyclohydrolase [bacterium]